METKYYPTYRYGLKSSKVGNPLVHYAYLNDAIARLDEKHLIRLTYSPEKLIQVIPGRSSRASAIYLGWALHLLHDLSHPYSAVNKTGHRHQESEKLIDVWLCDRCQLRF